MPDTVDIVIPAVDPPVAYETAEAVTRTAGMDHTVHVIEDTERTGFMRTVNRGFATTANDVLVLNDDVRIPTTDWLAKLYEALHLGVRVASVGAGGNCRTSPQREAKREWGLAETRYMPVEVNWLAWFCVLIKRDALDDVGYLDEAFLSYGGDVDWALRAKDSGWRHFWVPHVYVDHEVARWSEGDEEREAERQERWDRDHALLRERWGV